MPGEDEPEDDIETVRGAPERSQGPPSPPKKLDKGRSKPGGDDEEDEDDEG